jgi:hypothetical protein
LTRLGGHLLDLAHLVALAAVSTPRISVVNGADFASGEPIGICVGIFFAPENGCG